jgi:uncharacterized membrane protein (UPF0127 family)
VIGDRGPRGETDPRWAFVGVVPRRLQKLPGRQLRSGATVHEATTFASRLLGLALLGGLPSGHGLLIPRCRSVHTFGMRFRLDVAFLDDRGRAIRVELDVPSRRVLFCRAAFAVLETRAGDVELFVDSRR